MKCAQCFFTHGDPSDDTCRRCSRNFTRSELVEVVVLGVLYFLVCRLTHYLFTGEFFRRILAGGLFFPLSGFRDLFVFPVNVAEHPWHIVTIGLALAVIVLLPALVGMFYGMLPGLIVAVVGGFHVPVPFFFVLSAGSAVLAGRAPLRKFRPETMLLLAASVPMAYILVLAGPTIGARIGVVAWMPFVVMVLVSAASTLPIVWFARRREYHARFLCWMTGVVTLTLVVSFYGSVGFSKIEYAFIRAKHSAGSSRFRIVVAPASAGVTPEARRAQARAVYDARRTDALKAFTRYIDWFPRSADTARARFERGEVHNARILFAGTRPDVLKIYTDRITRDALGDYQVVREEFGQSSAVLETRLRAARYFLQHSQAVEARKLPPLRLAERELRQLVDYCEVNLPLDYRPPPGGSVLGRWRTHRLSGEERDRLLHEVRLEAKRDLAFLGENTDYNRIPVMLTLQLDPREPGYHDALRQILRWFPDCRLADNLKLELLVGRSCTVAAVEKLLEEYPTGDAAPRMLLILANRYRTGEKPGLAKQTLERLIRDFPDADDARRARELLKELGSDDAKP